MSLYNTVFLLNTRCVLRAVESTQVGVTDVVCYSGFYNQLSYIKGATASCVTVDNVIGYIM